MVICHRGFAYVPDSERISLILNVFSTNLKAALIFTQKALPRMDEDDRIMPILHSLAKQSLSKEYQISSGDGKEYRADDVPSLMSHFPPCMLSLGKVLQRDLHLKHNGRIQFGLFLKGIGLSLEESLIFWRKSFSKLSDDEFNKKGYPYNIRYNYGMEGKRTNYTPYSCVKMISSLPGPNDTHGCPFRQFSSERLVEMMESYGVSGGDAEIVTKKAKEGHYQLACTRLFELSKGKIHDIADEIEGFGRDNDGALMLLQGMDHPNRWFEMSMMLQAQK
jgi:DNA primase large subunit